jgi:hypothetical protein
MHNIHPYCHVLVNRHRVWIDNWTSWIIKTLLIIYTLYKITTAQTKSSHSVISSARYQLLTMEIPVLLCSRLTTNYEYWLTNFWFWSLLYSLGTDCIQNTASNSSSIVACLYVSMEMCLSHCYLAMAVPSCSTILAFSHHVTICTPTYTMNILRYISLTIRNPHYSNAKVRTFYIWINKCDYKACTAYTIFSITITLLSHSVYRIWVR